MLSSALPPLDRHGVDSIGEMAEAFNLTALGAYPTIPLASRTIQSFTRSYGMDNLKVHPKAVDGTPGWCVAYYTTGDIPTIIVAIAGIQSLNDLLAWISERFSIPLAGTAGTVNQRFLGWANNIITALAADPDWVANTNHRRFRLRLAGFSAGAGVAEIMAAILQLAHPTWDIGVRKFGSPTVGTRHWVRWSNDNLTKASWYVNGDPIVNFPKGLVTRANIFSLEAIPLPGPQQWQRMSFEGDAQTIDPDGNFGMGMDSAPLIESVRLVAQLPSYSEFTSDPFNPPNRWWLHVRTTFRWCLQRALRRHSSTLNFYRMLGLEYPNENQWNELFHLRDTVTPDMLTLADPAPDPIEVPPEIMPRGEADTHGDTSGGDWTDSTDDDAVSGGDWGPVPQKPDRTIRIRLRR